MSRSSLLASREEIKQKIHAQGQRLSALTAAEDKRVKKRVLQTLGKLKKQLQVLEAELETVATSQQGTEEGGSASTSTTTTTITAGDTHAPVWNRKKAKLKLKIVNDEIAELALKKQLKLARKRFNWLGNKGLSPDVHSFTNLLNAYVRCGDTVGAEEVWMRMLNLPIPVPGSGSDCDSKPTNTGATTGNNSAITPNVVTCTTLIKGYCESGSMLKAQAVFMRMLDQGSADISDIISSSSSSMMQSSAPPAKKAKQGPSGIPSLPLPNSRTLNTLLRGCIRGGTVHIAHEVFVAVAQAEASLGLDITDETSLEYTIALYCQALNLSAAEKLYALFLQLYAAPLPPPTTSSANSYHENDNSLGEGMAKVLPHALSQLAAIYVSLSRAYAITGDHGQSEKYEAVGRVTIQSAKSNILLNAMKANAEKDKGGGHQQHHRGKGRGSGGGNNSTSALFQQHRYAELTRDCDLIRAYNVSCSSSPSLSSRQGLSPAVLGLSKVLLLNELTASISNNSNSQSSTSGGRTNSISVASSATTSSTIGNKRKIPPQTTDSDSDSDSDSDNMDTGTVSTTEDMRQIHTPNDDQWFCSLKASMVQNLLDKFGLDHLCQFSDSSSSGSGDADGRSLKALAMNTILRNTSATSTHDRTDTANNSTRSGYCVRFDRLFQLCTSHNSSIDNGGGGGGGDSKLSMSSSCLELLTDPDLHVKLEIGSGSGEWVVQQAISDQHKQDKGEKKKVLWVSLEQRVDRVYQTYQHSLMRHTTDSHNLAILGGDASLVLPELIHSSCVQQVFVNHPEPPERSSGGEDMSQGQHLLTASFFKEMHRVLKPGGSVTIVSDNRLYATALAKIVDGLNAQLGGSAGVLMFSSPEVGTGYDSQGDDDLEDDNDDNAVAAQKARKKMYHQEQKQSMSMIVDKKDISSDNDDDDDDDEKEVDDEDKFLAGDDLPRHSALSSAAGKKPKTTVWSGDPGSKAGHVAQHVSSYFSRLWKNGNKSRVWYLFLRKCT